jgi:phage shock protein PspC (stress-responsive transcriptional regulator)
MTDELRDSDEPDEKRQAEDEPTPPERAPSVSEFDLNARPNDGDGPAEPRRLRRSAHERMVAGVAGGISEYFDVDPVLVRVAFVLLAVFGAGLGLIVYAVAWLVMPGPIEADRPLSGRRRRTVHRGFGGGLIFGLVLIIVGAAALLASVDAFNPGGDWILVGLAALLVLIGAIILVEARRGLNGGMVFWGMVVTVVLVVALQVDLSFQSGFGERQVAPSSTEQLESSYSHAFGSMDVDLRDLDLPPGTTRLTLDIAFGELTVDLPSGMGWRVEADTVFGSTQVPGREFSGIAIDGVATSND